MTNLYEDETRKFIWGIKSYDDMSGSEEANLWTMNDFDITYLKDENRYALSVETIYQFDQEHGEKNYISQIFSNFATWMLDNGYKTNYKVTFYDIFTAGLNINTHFESIEEAYGVFKVLANAYINS